MPDPACTHLSLTCTHLPAPDASRRVALLKVDVERAELRVLQGVAQQDWPAIEQVVMEVGGVLGRHLGRCSATSAATMLLCPPPACAPPCHRLLACWLAGLLAGHSINGMHAFQPGWPSSQLGPVTTNLLSSASRQPAVPCIPRAGARHRWWAAARAAAAAGAGRLQPCGG
jgi:hypothetical protein